MCETEHMGLLQLTKLQKVDVRWCPELKENEGVEHMSLEMLDISRCPKL
jgi:hypothetical protein